MTGPATVTSDLDRVVDALRSADRFLLTTHEGPDGDALGSLLAMHQVLGQLGKDSVMFLAAKEFPLAIEYRFLPLEEVFHEPPADVIDRTLVFLDCGNIDRMPVDFLQRDGARVLNIDHHHDNTRFGAINLVDTDASCTAEIVLEVAKRLGAEITPEIASALYVGLVTDTGKFMYENTAAGLSPGRSRADRGRGRRQRYLSEALRAGPDREAALDRPGAREGRALRLRPAGGHLHQRRGL